MACCERPCARVCFKFGEEFLLKNMIGLLIIAHAPFASALLQCVRHVYCAELEHCGQCATLDIEPMTEIAEAVHRARAICASLDSGQGVLVLTDLFGGTPSNIAQQLAEAGRIEVLSGANLPMLLRALSYRSRVGLAELVAKASWGASAGVIKMTSIAPQNQRLSPMESDDASTRLPDHQ